MTQRDNDFIYLWQEFSVCDDVFPTWILQKNGSHRPLFSTGTDQLDVDIPTRWTGSIQSGGGDRSVNSSAAAWRVNMTTDNYKL